MFFEPVTGSVTDRLDVAGQVAAQCQGMLLDGVQRLVDARSMGEDVE